MKILFVCNYNSWSKVAKGIMPSHHLFGVMEMIDHFDSPSSAVLKKSFGGGEIEFVCVCKPTKKQLLELYLKTFRYDVVYDVLNSVSKPFGVLNKFHLFKPRLVSILHHPPFEKQLRLAKSDCSVFFEEALMENARKFCSDNREMVVNDWGPDKAWYDKNKHQWNEEKEFDFLDNGKTNRDHNLFIRCMRKMPDKKGVIVTDEKHIPSEYREGENVSLFFQDKPNDFTMLRLCLKSRVMVVPLIENGCLLGPIGATSFMDAIALGMPVVTNKCAAFAGKIEKNLLGATFEANEDDFIQALNDSLLHFEEYHKNMVQYSFSHSIMQYSERLRTYLLK